MVGSAVLQSVQFVQDDDGHDERDDLVWPCGVDLVCDVDVFQLVLVVDVEAGVGDGVEVVRGPPADLLLQVLDRLREGLTLPFDLAPQQPGQDALSGRVVPGEYPRGGQDPLVTGSEDQAADVGRRPSAGRRSRRSPCACSPLWPGVPAPVRFKAVAVACVHQ
jgi:hypothetical protein